MIRSHNCAYPGVRLSWDGGGSGSLIAVLIVKRVCADVESGWWSCAGVCACACALSNQDWRLGRYSSPRIKSQLEGEKNVSCESSLTIAAADVSLEFGRGGL